jgi:chromosome partitioning protein
MKGGVGKTTVTMHVAAILARYKLGAQKPRKVLVVDYDPQFNLSQAFLPAKTYFELEGQKKTTLSVLIDDDSDLDPYKLQVLGNHNPPKPEELVTRIYTTDDGILDLLPSTLDLMYVALGQANAKTKPMEERFEKFIDHCRSFYDFIFIDCHPAGSLFTKTALRNSDHVLIPVAPQRFAVRGIELMMEFTKVKKQGQKGAIPHILLNLLPRGRVPLQMQEIRNDPKYGKYCLNSSLTKYKAFGDPEGGKGFVWNSRKSYSTEAFDNLVDVTRELLGRIGGGNI